MNVMGKTLEKLMEKQNDLHMTMNQLLSEHERASYQRKRKRGSTLELGDHGQEGSEAAAADPPIDEDVTQTLVVTGVVD